MKKELIILFLLASLTSCGQSSGDSLPIVNIEKLSAVKNVKKDKNSVLMKENEQISKDLQVLGSQQEVLLFDYETDFTLTIELDNPKAYNVDAIQITSKDVNAQIMVDGIYRPIHIDKQSRVVNWSQEDPYQKDFYIKSTLLDNDNYVEILDIKINGEWQSRNLDNNVLNIKRITHDNFSFKHIYTTFDEYRFELVRDNSISNLSVTGADENEDGTFSVTREGLVEWSYDYSIGEDLLSVMGSKEIEFLQVVDTYNSYFDGSNILSHGTESQLVSFRHTLSKIAEPNMYRFWFKIIQGTEVDFSKIKVHASGKAYVFNVAAAGWTPGFDCLTFEPNSKIDVEIGGFIYSYANNEAMLPSGIRWGDDSYFDLK